jgi:hypothetical protein
MTEKQAARALDKGCPKGCSGLDVHEDLTPVIDLMQALKDSLPRTRSHQTRRPDPMTATQRMCTLCGKEPAEVPDREKGGGPIKAICRSCHGKRLMGDMRVIMEQARRRSSDLLSTEEPPTNV